MFCHENKSTDIEAALKQSNTDAHIVTFDKGPKFTSFLDFFEEKSSDKEINDFK